MTQGPFVWATLSTKCETPVTGFLAWTHLQGFRALRTTLPPQSPNPSFSFRNPFRDSKTSILLLPSPD